MGLSYTEMLNCTWLEFDYYQAGHTRRLERGWDEVRHLISSMYNSSGFVKSKVSAKDIMKLPMLDKVVVKVPRRIPASKVNQLLKAMG